VEKVVDKFVAALEGQLADKNVEIELTEAARKYLAKAGYDPAMGARPLGRVIQEKVKRPLAEEILFGKLSKGGLVLVDYVDGKLDFVFQGHKEGSKGADRSKKSQDESEE